MVLVPDSPDHDYKNLIWRRLTPELSRAALRPWASETCKNLHEAAKRARLERIVRLQLCLVLECAILDSNQGFAYLPVDICHQSFRAFVYSSSSA